MKRIAISVLITLISGCSSYHNINKDGSNSLGGGFSDKEIHEGLYYIVSKTNFAPWSNHSAAYKTFNRRAAELCNSKAYKAIEISESEYEHIQTAGAAKYIISQVTGYIICKPEVLSEAEALIYIQENL
ncbi:MAG: hypothetical protein PHE38_10025 [Alishewanella agri]|uniref:hypothetical protein n=1 Tax=Alishewanella TaxID=111142 RepID=UPI0011465EAF|nr:MULTISPECIES: hypothetical protein [Alishewanella]MDD4864337.1 hypothetical protein [Alishewanella agri]